MSNQGMATCKFCGAEYRLFTIANKNMQGFCKVWKNRHEHSCKNKTPEQRLKWAKKYIGKTSIDSSIVVDITHPGFAK